MSPRLKAALVGLVLGGCKAVLGIEDWEPRLGAADAGPETSTASGGSSSIDASDTGVSDSRSSAGGDSGRDVDSGDPGKTIAAYGEPCSEAGAGACLAHASNRPLVCDGSVWKAVANCPDGSLCDTTPGPGAGQCRPMVAACAGAKGGDGVCRGMETATCGPDLLSIEAGKTCTAVTESCVDGACVRCAGSSRNCDSVASDCETNLADVATCGTSCSDEVVCSSAHGTAACVAGACTMSACQTPYADCEEANDGCETDLTSPHTCGTTCNDRVACAWPTPSCVSGGCAVTPSCRGLAATCGATGDHSCCASVLVAGGEFKRSYDGVYFTDSSFPATVSDFRLDKYEVTVGRFRKFKIAWDAGWRPDAGAGKHAHLNGGLGLANTSGTGHETGWDAAWVANVTMTDGSLGGCWSSTWTPLAGTQENRPIACANWYELYAFCTWDEGFLPSEAEWNFAASAGTEQRVYPWSVPPGSTSIDCTKANYLGGAGPTPCFPTFMTNVGSLSPAGDGKFGHADFGGNVWEWVLDAKDNYGSCTDCAVPWSSTGNVIIRGGSAGHPPLNIATSLRGDVGPATREADIGVRCARAP